MCDFQKEIRQFYNMSSQQKYDRENRFLFNTELIHACLGLSGETGEIIDLIKKHVAYGKELDYTKLSLELGDCLHYLCRVIDLTGFSLQEIMNKNLIKLNSRYPNGYSDQDAINKTELKEE